MRTRQTTSQGVQERVGGAEPAPADRLASSEHDAALPHRGRHDEGVEAAREAEAVRKARRQGLMLMGASAALMIVLLGGAWLLLR
jgi:hypothetical protein